jgi:multidrug efflux system outer membrane protein
MMTLRLPERSVTACALAIALVATSCTTVGPDYQRPEVKPPAAYPHAAGEDRDLANHAWWTQFHDPALTALIQEAIDANKDLLVATYRVEQFAARLGVSEAALFPQVGVNGSRERVQLSQEQPALLASNRDPAYNNYALNATASWEVDFWGRVARANEVARAELLATQHARRAVMLRVVSAVADTYVQLLALDRRLELARLVLANRRDAEKLQQLKYEGGSATLLDVNRASAAAEEVESTIAPIERDIARSENAVALLLSRNPGTLKRGTLAALLMPRVPQGVPSDVIEARPDVAAAEQTLVAANAHIGVAKSQYLPTVSLTAALGLASDQMQWLLARTARTGQLGAGFTGVLFDGGRIKSDVKNAEAVQREMAEAYLKAIQTALREVDDALAGRAKAGEQVEVLARRLKTRQDGLRLAKLRFEGGKSTLLEVLEADRDVLSALEQHTLGVRDEYASLVAIYNAMGGGWMLKEERARVPRPAPTPGETVTSQATTTRTTDD